MLTSSANHYLRPEYLNPIQGNNIELDAKKSPLALLAQTCSQIGADAHSQKNGQPAEKGVPKGKLTPGDKSPSDLSMTGNDDFPKSSATFKPYERKKDDEEERTTPVHKRTTPCGRSPSATSFEPLRTTSRSSDGGRTPINVQDLPSSSISLEATTKRHSTSPISSSVHSLCSLGDLTKDPLAAYKLAPSLYSPLSLGLEHLGAAGLSALTAKVSSAHGTSSCSSSSSLTNPYIGYARVKTPNGTEVIIPVCRDPYCTGCQINTHALQVVNGTCPQGCVQCIQAAAHTKALSSLPQSLISSLPSSSLNSLYPPPGLIGGSHHPYVCNWIAGESYCGKRFTSSEELLQHLRSHTTLSSPSEVTLGLPPLHHHPLLSAALPRGYPTPPLSPLSAARFHPYAKSALSHLSPGNPLTSAAASALSVASLSALSPHPLSAYYNPYSIYARGLGATVPGLHP